MHTGLTEQTFSSANQQERNRGCGNNSFPNTGRKFPTMIVHCQMETANNDLLAALKY